MPFYEDKGDGRFVARAETAGPWDPRHQHGSPPAALLARAIERAFPRDDARLAHLAFDFHGPIPIGELTVTTEVLRPGAKIERTRATMSFDGRAVLEASAWRIAAGAGRATTKQATDVTPMPKVPAAQAPVPFVDVAPFGYAESLEWRFVEGSFAELGPAAVWTRPRVPIVDGEEPSALGRLLLMVDSANGISAELSPTANVFVPVDLTVSVERHPRTDWVGMRARTTIAEDGVGITRADLFDEEGFLGVAVQTLFVAAR